MKKKVLLSVLAFSLLLVALPLVSANINPSDYDRRLPITENSTEIVSNENGFALYFDLSNIDSSDPWWNVVQNDGGDVRVTTDADGTGQLPLELVSINTTAHTGEMHFKYNITNTTADTYHLWAGTSNTSSQPAVTDTFGRNNVWTQYDLVYHMGSTTPDDATGNHGGGSVSQGNPSITQEGMGTAVLFDGDDAIDTGWSPSYGGGKFTQTAIVNPDSQGDSGDDGSIASTFDSNEASQGTLFSIRDGGSFRGYISNNPDMQGGNANVGTNEWVTWRRDGSNNVNIYENGSSVASGSGGGSFTGGNVVVGGVPDSGLQGSRNLHGTISELRLTSNILSTGWISTEYNMQNDNSGFWTVGSSVVVNPITLENQTLTPSSPEQDDALTTTADYTHDDGDAANITVQWIQNGNAAIENDTITNLANGSLINETIDLSNYAISDGDNITASINATSNNDSVEINQTVNIENTGTIEVKAFEKISNQSISSFNITTPVNASTSNGTLIAEVDVGNHTLTANADGYLNTMTQNVEVKFDQTTTVNLTGFYTANVTLNVTDGNNDSDVTGYNVTITDTDHPDFEETQTNVSGDPSFGLINGSYTLQISHPSYADLQTGLNVTGTETVNLELYPDPSSVRVTVRRESDGTIMDNTNITLTVSNDIGEDVFDITAGVDNGTKFVGNLTPDNYTFKFQATGFSTRSYALEVGEDTTQSLTAYLAQTNQTVIFTVIDDNTLAPIPQSDVLIERSINGTWTTVENRKTDVTGRVQFTFIIGEAYRITADADGYNPRTFTLDPILFTSYNIPLSKTSTVESRVNTRLEPNNPRFVESETTTVKFTFIAPGGNLQSYQLTWTTPDGNTVTRSGTQATGQTFTGINIPVGTVDIGDQVTLEYSYTDTSGDTTTRKNTFGVLDDQLKNNTFAGNINKTYGGFGDFQRIVTVGAGAAGAGGVGGIVAGATGAVTFILAVYAFAAYAGIINAWSIAVTVIIGIGLLWFRGGR